MTAAAASTILVVHLTASGNSDGNDDYKDDDRTLWSPSPDALQPCPSPIALPRRGDGPPPPPATAGSSVGYMVHSNRQGHLPFCQIIYMTIGILLKMLVSDRGGVAVAAADSVNDGGLSYSNNNDDNVKDKK